MAGETQKAKAEKLRALHAAGVLVLPNAWDAGSAAMIALADAQAIATTGGGIAWSLGRHKGQGLTRAEYTNQCSWSGSPPEPDSAGRRGSQEPNHIL